MRKLIFLCFAVISVLECEKLSTTMDEKRAETCGRVNQPDTASKASKEEGTTPWSIRALHGKTRPFTFASATLISQRHVLTRPLISCTDGKCKAWKWVIDGTPIDIKKCTGDVMEVPKKTLAALRVSLSVCRDAERCGTDIERSVVAAHYIGSCELGLEPFGVLLLEISSNVPNDVDYFRAVCIPDTADAFKIGDKAEVHGAGSASAAVPRKYVRTTSTVIQKCPSWRFNGQICSKYAVCYDEFGGGLVKKIDGKQTLVGIVVNHEGRNCTDSKYNTHVSVGHYRDKICDLAGICRQTTGPSEATGARFGGIWAAVLLISFLLNMNR